MNADGSGLRRLRAGAAAQPDWSPDATLIAFTSNRFGGDIQSLKSDGSGLQNLRAKGSSPSWSPDGGWLAFDWGCDDQFGGNCDSPDGTQNDCGPECGIGVVASDGRGVRRLGNGMWPDWGPNGRIIFTDGVPASPCHYRPIGRGQDQLACTLPVWVMNADGSARTRLPVDKAVAPTWSHDGRRIAYYTPTDGVFIANSDGTGIVKVAPAGYEDPSWSPDGRWLAVIGYTEHQDRCGFAIDCLHDIYLRGIDGSSERRLTSSGNDLQPAFSPRP
jgi:Tol biopolymer transport system component